MGYCRNAGGPVSHRFDELYHSHRGCSARRVFHRHCGESVVPESPRTMDNGPWSFWESSEAVGRYFTGLGRNWENEHAIQPDADDEMKQKMQRDARKSEFSLRNKAVFRKC